MEKEIYVYDLETYPNLFLAVFKSLKTKEYTIFEISHRRNQNVLIRQFLRDNVKGLIGFNNTNFDYPVLHNTLLKTQRPLPPEEIYEEVQKVINTQYAAIWDNQTKIPQLDLYKIWHYDNKNKATSLKWLEFAMRLENVEDLPYKVGSILTDDQIDKVIDYCKNDIDATEKFYYKSLKHIQIRKFYTELEGMNLMNASEIKMSKNIFGKYLSKEMKIDMKTLSGKRTHRSEVDIKDIIFDYIKFNDPLNQEVLEKFNSYKWIDTSNMTKEQAKKYAITFSRKYKNVVREFAEGGLHSFGKSGIYESDDEYVLVDVDFASYYPHISFRNKLHPAHIPEPIFSKIYEGFYTDRKKYDKKDPRNYVLKIILNGSYGLSKDKNAFLYDPKWQLAICINGQLMLTLLTEKIYEKCEKDVQIIFENTDGAMYRIHKSDYENLISACDVVGTLVNIPLETQICQKIIAKDVNNYINIIGPSNIKFKGAFEIDRDFHKNHSKRIVPIALAEYFINGIKPEDYIPTYLKSNSVMVVKEWNDDTDEPTFYEHHGIYDFCLGAKMKGQNELFQRYWKGHELIDEPLSKMVRYYVSNTGVELIKKLPPLEKHYLTETDKFKAKYGEGQMNIFDLGIEDVIVEPEDRDENLESGYKCTIFNRYKEYDYDLNYEYYINECNKVINTLK
ncbi:MAG TPA: hypothetical protein VF680_17070 [Allosphingosinicella sp.]|jgi:hypothetical protein